MLDSIRLHDVPYTLTHLRRLCKETHAVAIRMNAVAHCLVALANDGTLDIDAPLRRAMRTHAPLMCTVVASTTAALDEINGE